MKLSLGFLIFPIIAASCGRGPTRSIREMPSDLNAKADVSDYQIGPDWGKTVVTAANLGSASPQFQRAARATAKLAFSMGGATGFALGEKDGVIRLATNHHVIGKAADCRGVNISFPLLGISGLRCDTIVGTWTDIDLTVFTIKGYTEEQRTLILSVARDFSYNAPLRKGEKLMTIGFGVAGNSSQRSMMAEQSDDCKVYSQDDDTRFIADPDEINPGPYKTWTFSVGCDVSHGDSGSAMFDRQTGAVVGILSTGKIPKNKIVLSRQWLDDQYASDGEGVWKELTFAVPAVKINEIAGPTLRR